MFSYSLFYRPCCCCNMTNVPVVGLINYYLIFLSYLSIYLILFYLCCQLYCNSAFQMWVQSLQHWFDHSKYYCNGHMSNICLRRVRCWLWILICWFFLISTSLHNLLISTCLQLHSTGCLVSLLHGSFPSLLIKLKSRSFSQPKICCWQNQTHGTASPVFTDMADLFLEKVGIEF